MAAGEYVVDPHAVAEAILRRRDDLREARRLSRMLVAREDDRIAPRAEQPQPRPGGD